MNNDYEMVIHCPVCGQEAVVKLETDNSEDVVSACRRLEVMASTDGLIMKTDSFEARDKCASCGADIGVTASVIGCL